MTTPSRRKRNRHRRRTAEATARKPGHLGGFGGGAPIRRSDFQLVEKAIRQNWEVPLRTKTAVLREAFRVFNDPDAPVRLQLAAVRFLVTAEGANQRADFAERKPN